MEELYVDLIRNLQHTIKETISNVEEKPNYIKNITQARIIFYLSENEDKVIYQKDICEALKLKKSSITEHLDYLELENVIKRIPDENDKRKNHIVLSKKIKDKQKHLENTLSRTDKKMTKNITQKELTEFKKIVKKMEDNLKG